MREQAAAGMMPSKIIRKVFDQFGAISPFVLVDYFMEAFLVRHEDVMPYLNSWWHDPAVKSELTDEQLDGYLWPPIERTKSLWLKN